MERLKRERAALEDLCASVDWLSPPAWTFEAQGLAVDVIITAHGHPYALRLLYPNVYPAVPPAIRPVDGERLSGHQYGNGGPLCLEYSGDNWSPELTGADMFESAHRLLELENPKGTGGPPAPTRHELSQGQDVRGSIFRVLVRPELLDALEKVTVRHGRLECANLFGGEAFVTLISSAATASGELWRDQALPSGIKAARDHLGLFVKTAAPLASLLAATGLDAVERVLAKTPNTPDTLRELLDLYHPDRPAGSAISLLLLDEKGQAVSRLAFSAEGPEFYTATVVMTEADGQHQRTPHELSTLAQKRIGLVGLGSVGSKITLSLARAGARRFYLLDEDVLLPENLVRHALDYRSVGQHRTQAALKALEQLVPGLEVQTSEMNLTGQENNALLGMALADLGACDVIIDATASPDVFRILREVALTYRTPLVWGRVFAGGIGGLLARSRPDRDPEPAVLNGAYLAFCELHPFAGADATINYGSQRDDGVVVAASDAEVGIIAHYLVLLAEDTLTESGEAQFPYALYLLGLRKAWVFQQPFHIVPITPEASSTKWSRPVTSDGVSEALSVLKELLEP